MSRHIEPGRGRGRPLAGFTLLELLVVIVIIGLLAGIVAPNLFRQLTASEVTTARAQMKSLGDALDQFRLDSGRYPTTQEGLRALMQPPAGALRWRGPYLRKDLPQDPWGHDYLYEITGANGQDFRLKSFGKDGSPGGDGDNADIIL